MTPSSSGSRGGACGRRNGLFDQCSGLEATNNNVIKRRENLLLCQLMAVCVVMFASGSLPASHGFTVAFSTARRRSIPLSSSLQQRNDVSRAATSLSHLQASSNNSNELMPLRRGSSVALVTPFDPTTGNVDVASLRRLFQYHLESNTDNLCLLGTTAEAGVLTMDERELILKVAADEIKGRIPIMVGCGTIDPKAIKSMVQQAVDCGADAALIVTPYYVKPPQRSLITHFTTAATYGLPVIIYNVPSRTGVDMADASIALAAAAHEGIVAVKDATGKLERLPSLRAQLSGHGIEKDKVLLYSGDDATSMDFVLQGGDGCISVTANVAASALHQIMAAALKGDTSAATALNTPLQSLHNDLFCEANPIPVKYALAKNGLGLIQSPYCRPPLDALDASYHAILDAALQQASLVQSKVN